MTSSLRRWRPVPLPRRPPCPRPRPSPTATAAPGPHPRPAPARTWWAHRRAAGRVRRGALAVATPACRATSAGRAAAPARRAAGCSGPTLPPPRRSSCLQRMRRPHTPRRRWPACMRLWARWAGSAPGREAGGSGTGASGRRRVCWLRPCHQRRARMLAWARLGLPLPWSTMHGMVATWLCSMPSAAARARPCQPTNHSRRCPWCPTGAGRGAEPARPASRHGHGA